MNKKLSKAEYYELFTKEDVSDQEILEYSNVVKGNGGFEWQLEPDPDKVDITQEELALEGVGDVVNSLARSRRASRFRRRLANNELPILVSEGDSWFQFPFLIKEVIDQLENDFLIWSVGAAGDTASNMVLGERRRGKTEYLTALKSQAENVSGFLFSGAGNDIIGEDPVTGDSSLYGIIKDYQPGQDDDPRAHIDFDVFGQRMSFLKEVYQTVIASIREEPEFAQLPIFFHGYDYVFPFPWQENDPRNPIYAKNDEWLGEPFSKRGYPDIPLRREIIKVLIDILYDMLKEVSGDSEQTKVWVINCRGAMPELTDWNDEIHGKSAGFAKVAARFRRVIKDAIG